MKGSAYGVLVFLITSGCQSSLAYELVTHGQIAAEAYRRSNLYTDIQLFNALGLNPEESIARQYYEIRGNSVWERVTSEHAVNKGEVDKSASRVPEHAADETPLLWLMRGAVREDDVPWYGGGPLPWDDPEPGSAARPVRVLHHFYDPIHDRPLTVGGPRGERAPDWAQNTGATSNYYAIPAAREAQFRALTGVTTGGSPAIVPAGGGSARSPNDPAEAEQVRKGYWATAFRALGDVVHLVADMGQPQHTRNDAHIVNGVLDKKMYEVFTEARAKAGKVYKCSNGVRIPLPTLVFGAYPKPAFNDYRSYFTTATDQGLADYSNRGFFTAGTNIGSGAAADYPAPRKENLSARSVQHLDPCLPSTGADYIDEYWVGAVPDSVAPGYADHNSDGEAYAANEIPLSARGLFSSDDPQVWPPETELSYTLTEDNYTAMADLLLPRAASYAAGFLDYFFRGRLEITPPDEGVYAVVDHATVNGIDAGFTKVKLKLRNVTQAAGGNDQEVGAGKLWVVARYRRNPCYEPDLSGEIGALPGGDIPSGNYINGCSVTPNPTEYEQLSVSTAVDITGMSRTQSGAQEFDFSAAPIPLNATDLHLQVVYRGVLGSEADAIALGARDVSEPSYIAVSNSTDYVMVELSGEFHTATEIRGDPSLTELIDQRGNKNGDLDERIDAHDLLNLSIGFGGSSYIAHIGRLPPAHHVRLAFLSEPDESLKVFSRADNDSQKGGVAALRVIQTGPDNVRIVYPIDPCFGPYRGTHYREGIPYYIDMTDTTQPETIGMCTQNYENLVPLTEVTPRVLDHLDF